MIELLVSSRIDLKNALGVQPFRFATRLGLAIACLGLVVTSGTEAQTIVGIVSEASAPEFAAAAAVFVQDGREGRLVFRSTAQIARASDQELAALVRAADVLVLTAVFGEEATRLLRIIKGHPPQTVALLHGDSRLMSLSRVDGRRAFAKHSGEIASTQLRKLAATKGRLGPFGNTARPEAVLAQARRYRSGRGTRNLANMLAFLAAGPEKRNQVAAPEQGAKLRVLVGGQSVAASAEGLNGVAALKNPTVALFDYAYGDRAGDRDVHQQLCNELGRRGLGCLSVLARWGQPSIDALKMLQHGKSQGALNLQAVVMLQDFVVGGGAGAKAAESAITALDVPVLKAVRMTERSVGQWAVSEDGLADDSVHYRLSMPEIQGIGQAFVVAAAGPSQIDAITGLELQPLQGIAREIEAMAARISRWHALRTKTNAEKRVALVYYNHPPGRHNIGADNLDVPASLLSILRHLQKAGYQTGPLPGDEEALLELLQARGVNLPENGPALAAMSGKVATMSAAAYQIYYEGLPSSARRMLSEGPLGGLIEAVRAAKQTGDEDVVLDRVERVLGDIKHLLEGAVHPLRDEVLIKVQSLTDAYRAFLGGNGADMSKVEALSVKLRATGIEGLSGWGKAPGNVMVADGQLVLPGITFGNVFIGPQPPRGWELAEELLHANLAFPPPHQYLAFYEHLRSQHKADVVVHVGRHSTYEFLPGRRTGLGAADFSRLVLGDLPSVYIYIVDGVGEGIQAKRRGQAVIVDHLTPSLSTTPLYDELLALRQLVESYEAGAGIKGHAGARALTEVRATIDRLNLREELVVSMASELEARGIGYEDVDGELLVHEVGHYLTKLQERFMPHGLHIFGQDWGDKAVERMLLSMAGDKAKAKGREPWRVDLRASPAREAQALLAALDGRFVRPGPGNDPVRTPEVLPTGRNFHALDASVLPTRLGYKLGAELAGKALETPKSSQDGTDYGSEAVVLWASDTVRDEGAMVAFGMHMMGVSPVWSNRGIVRGVERLSLGKNGVRRDTTFVTSGLFRDLYSHLTNWLDQAVLAALEGAQKTIELEHPELKSALAAALSPLANRGQAGAETLVQNQLAARWVETAAELLATGATAEQAGWQACARIFGDAPGSYGAGVNRLVERSGSWTSREELADTYVRRMGHAYGGGRAGAPAHAAFKRVLARTQNTYLGRSSNLYGVLDNNDVFDYLGGLGMAIEKARGTPPNARIVQHANPNDVKLDPLPTALLQELRGRHLNPVYLKGLMDHGYAGARTMGSGFVENLWGWQVTSPHIVKSWVWDEVKAVYLDDKHGIGMREFLNHGQNVHVRTNMQAVMLVAAHKGFWQADSKTLAELSESFAKAVIEHGLPGSGHTRPDHPMMAAVKDRLSAELAAQFQQVLDTTLGKSTQAMVSELEATDPNQSQGDVANAEEGAAIPTWIPLVAIALVLLGLGFVYEKKRGEK